MSEDECEDISKRLRDIERYRRAFADIEDCIGRIEWEVVKQRGRELREEFQKIYAKVNQVKFQYAIDQEALRKGDISQAQFEKKLMELIRELSGVDLDLDCMKPKVCRFIEKINEFVKEDGAVEDENVIIDILNDAMVQLKLSENELKQSIRERQPEKEGNSRERIDVDKVEKKIQYKKILYEERNSGIEKEPEDKEKLDREIKDNEEKERRERIRLKSQAQVKNFCPICGRKNKSQLKFCKSCGASLLKENI